MEVRHKVTGAQQTISKKDWETLEKTGHAKNFIVVQENDYQPNELSAPPAGLPPAAKPRGKPE